MVRFDFQPSHSEHERKSAGTWHYPITNKDARERMSSKTDRVLLADNRVYNKIALQCPRHLC